VGVEDDTGVAGCDSAKADGLARVRVLPGNEIRDSGLGKYSLAVCGAFLRLWTSATGTKRLKVRLGGRVIDDAEYGHNVRAMYGGSEVRTTGAGQRVASGQRHHVRTADKG
jgi:hypothetical protein